MNKIYPFSIIMLFAMIMIFILPFSVMAEGAQNEAQKSDLQIGVVLEPPHLDPTAGAAAAIDEIVYANLFEGLTRIDENGAVKPALAQSWDISEDSMTYRFYLVENAKFHDGSNFTAADVKFSLDRARGDDSVNAQKALFEKIAMIEIIDDFTIEITLTSPQNQFLFNLGWGDAVIVSETAEYDNKTHPIGTGPYQFKEWRKGDQLSLLRFDDYWGEKPYFETVNFRFLTDAMAGYAALIGGDIDMIPNLQARELLPRIDEDDRFTIALGTTEGETILALNHDKTPINNPIFRQALAHAIDRDAIINAAMSGFGTKIGSHFAPHHPAYVDFSNLYEHDSAKAQALFDQSGVEFPLTLTMKLPPPSYARRSGEMIAAQLKPYGIEIKQEPLEWAGWLDQVFRGDHDYDMTIIAHTEPMDIGIYARDDYYFNYENQEFNKIYSDLTNLTDMQAQYDALAEAQRILAMDIANVFLFQLPKAGVWRKELQNIWENAPIQANDITNVIWQDE